MPIINPAIIADREQSLARTNVNTNFTITALTASGQYPSATRLNIMGGLVNNQQLYIARDGSDYLSATTGVLKGTAATPIDQTIYGNLTVTGWIKAGGDMMTDGFLIGSGISINNNGSRSPNIIVNQLWVGARYSDLPSFVIGADRNSVAYGTLTVGSTLTVNGYSTIVNTLTAHGLITAPVGITAGASTFTGAITSNVLPTYTAFSTVGGISTGTLSANSIVASYITSNSGAHIEGPLEIQNSGDPANKYYVRPLYIGTAAAGSAGIPVGCLYGRY